MSVSPFSRNHYSTCSETSSYDQSSEGKKENQAKNELVGGVERTLKWKFEKAIAASPDYDSEDSAYEFPVLNYGKLAGIVSNFEGEEVVKKANSAYHWVITPPRGQSPSQYFLVTDRLLGQGAHGEVYHGFAHDIRDIKPCAVKRGNARSNVNPNEVVFLQRFMKTRSEDSNIIQLIAADPEQDIVVMELAQTNLFQIAKLNPKLSRKDIGVLIRGVLSGLNEIASKNIIHADIKPENIYIIERDGYFTAKIGDFGLSFRIGGKFKGGTRHFYAPELFYHFCGAEDLSLLQKYKLDVWSAMLVLGELGDELMSKKFSNRFRGYQDKIHTEVKSAQRKFPKKEARLALSQKMVEYFDQVLLKRNGLFSDLEPKTPMDNLMQKMAIIYPEDRISAHEALQLFDGLKPLPADDLELPLDIS